MKMFVKWMLMQMMAIGIATVSLNLNPQNTTSFLFKFAFHVATISKQTKKKYS